VKWTNGQRVDSPSVAHQTLHCLVCKGEILRGETFWQSGTANEEGEVEYWVFLHAECLSLLTASVASRVAA
jgi:hypothetical protein